MYLCNGPWLFNGKRDVSWTYFVSLRRAWRTNKATGGARPYNPRYPVSTCICGFTFYPKSLPPARRSRHIHIQADACGHLSDRKLIWSISNPWYSWLRGAIDDGRSNHGRTGRMSLFAPHLCRWLDGQSFVWCHSIFHAISQEKEDWKHELLKIWSLWPHPLLLDQVWCAPCRLGSDVNIFCSAAYYPCSRWRRQSRPKCGIFIVWKVCWEIFQSLNRGAVLFFWNVYRSWANVWASTYQNSCRLACSRSCSVSDDSFFKSAKIGPHPR